MRRPSPSPDDGARSPRARRARSIGSVLALLLLASAVVAARPVHRADDDLTLTAATQRRLITYRQWDSAAALRTGKLLGLVVSNGRLVLDHPTGRRSVGGTSYDVGSWTSPWVDSHLFTQLIASWTASTPGDSLLQINVRGRAADGHLASWDVMSQWAAGDRHLSRHSMPAQDDDLAAMDVDTWTAPWGLTSYQLRVALLRRHGTSATPSVEAVGAMVSKLPASAGTTSRPGPARGVVLKVPAYSQMIHRGHYPQWGGGGEAWCSPTSTSMVLGYYRALPTAKQRSWVPKGHADPWVDHAARMTYDHRYEGTGNWPFNTAYAGPLAGRAFVTRLRSLREAERFIAAGIPLVASIRFSRGQLDGAPISATAGHLIVIRGFDRAGDVVVNDPAAATDAGVHRTYDRGQLERAWLNGSGGVVYVIRDAAHRLPAGTHSNW